MGHWNRVARVRSRTQAMLTGWTDPQSTLPGTFWVGGEALTTAEIVRRLTRSRQAHDDIDRCRRALAFAIANRDAQLAKEQTLQEGLSAVLRQTLGVRSSRLASFGVELPKARARLSSEGQAIAAAKSRETRRVRRTQGSRQRQAITTEPQPTVTVLGLGEPDPEVAK